MRLILALTIALVASPALAHEGVMNPAVLERMEVMKQTGKAFRTLRQMNSGKVAFDALAAQAAINVIKATADKTPDLFRAQETDPKMEALPILWEQFADFEVKAAAMGKGADATINSIADLQVALPVIGASCGGCHDIYRMKKN